MRSPPSHDPAAAGRGFGAVPRSKRAGGGGRSGRGSAGGDASSVVAEAAGSPGDRFISKLQSLFARYDRDFSENISIEEFVEAQKIFACARRENFDEHAALSEFFELSMTGTVGYHVFKKWLMQKLASRGASEQEMEASVTWCVQQLEAARRKR
eukprot:CAMPEP_0172764716 /NCGR_PEP_ID=MMETSP1074-20121228/177739_1 /TAXON_ID=2916 /ORGANISM="Ceratium fusus, Strain PA161109" /LENGTH=153 /DNA_ID=CAMNT_0013599523 /DNA_START=34 /DNA_END=492 /DNA_ORIENTATION=-